MLGQGATPEQLMSLPRMQRNPFELVYLKDGVRTSVNLAPAAIFSPDVPETGSQNSVLDWIKENQTAVFAAAGVLLLLAVMGRRR